MNTKKQLNELLNNALELLNELETYANDEQQKRIDKLFKDVSKLNEFLANMQAQNFDVFGKGKI